MLSNVGSYFTLFHPSAEEGTTAVTVEVVKLIETSPFLFLQLLWSAGLFLSCNSDSGGRGCVGPLLLSARISLSFYFAGREMARALDPRYRTPRIVANQTKHKNRRKGAFEKRERENDHPKSFPISNRRINGERGRRNITFHHFFVLVEA